MTAVARRPLWAGRTLVLVAILLLALNLRTAVAALSPIVGQITADIPLDSVGLGIIGMLPPISFAASGLLAPAVARRLGIEATIVVAAVAMVVGPLVRAISSDYFVLVVGSVIALAGMGFGNILLPPAVKKYFPDRIGQITSAYATILAVSTALAALLASPVATAAGWRISLGIWAVLACFALVPWVTIWLAHRRDTRASFEAGLIVEATPELVGRLWHSRVAWSIAVAFGTSSLSAYAMFAWMPEMLQDIAGVGEAQAGALLSLYSIVGLPFSLLVPILAVRMRNVGLLIYAGVAFFVLGYVGLLFFPTTATWLWVLLAGAGPLIFSLCLVLINLRTRSTQSSVALSGFVQSLGYSIGAFGPLLVGLIHSASGGWQVPLIFLMATSLAGALSGIVLTKPLHVEDELARRAQRG